MGLSGCEILSIICIYTFSRLTQYFRHGQTNGRTEFLYQYRQKENLASKILCIFVTGGAYASYAPCLSTPLLINPLTHTVVIWIKHPVPSRSFVIFDIRALWRSRLSVRVPRCQKWRLNPVWHRMLYSSTTYMATLGSNCYIIILFNYLTQTVYALRSIIQYFLCNVYSVLSHYWCTVLLCYRGAGSHPVWCPVLSDGKQSEIFVLRSRQQGRIVVTMVQWLSLRFD